jgi:hypothetical protein
MQKNRPRKIRGKDHFQNCSFVIRSDQERPIEIAFDEGKKIFDPIFFVQLIRLVLDFRSFLFPFVIAERLHASQCDQLWRNFAIWEKCTKLIQICM